MNTPKASFSKSLFSKKSVFQIKPQKYKKSPNPKTKPLVLSFYQQMEQISDKNYFLPFALKSQQIVRLSISFSKETKNIAEVLVG